MNYYASDSIEVLNLSRRSFNALYRGGYMRVGQLAGLTSEQLYALKSLGQKSVDEILGRIQSIHVMQDVSIESDAAADPAQLKSAAFFRDAEGLLREDIPIAALGLSVRAINCLTGAGIRFASELVGLSMDELLAIRHMGRLTAQQILDTAMSVSFRATVELDPSACDRFFHGVIEPLKRQLSFHAGAAYPELAEIYFKTADEADEYGLLDRGDVWARICATPVIAGSIREKILRLCSESRYGVLPAELREGLPEQLSDAVRDDIIDGLLRDKLIYKTAEDTYMRKYISITDYAEALAQTKGNAFLLNRLRGLTLEDVGKLHENLTRERVRQVVQKQLDARPPVAEDYYTEVFQAYNWSKEDFSLAFDEPEETFNYLNMVYARGASKDLAELSMDAHFPISFRKAAERVIYKDCITVGNRRVRVKRTELVNFILRSYCSDRETTFDEFMTLYDTLLDEWGLSGRIDLAINERSYMNRFIDSDIVLWKYGKRFRYYDIGQYDFTELFEALSLKQYHNVEYSTLKFVREHPEIMRQYNIWDEYELHNLLKIICQPRQYPGLSFKRMPNIEFGVADRNEQVLDLLLRLAPISAYDFALAYEQEYGVLSQTVLANYVSCADKYFFNGVYKIDLPALPPEQSSRMKELLTESFYQTEDIVSLYLQAFPGSHRRNINPHALKMIGFKVYNGYVIAGRYASAIDYFRGLLLTPNRLDVRELPPGVSSIGVFVGELYRLKGELEILEYEPMQFVNIRLLEAQGVTKAMLRGYADDAAMRCTAGEFFTMKTLRAAGYNHPLDKLGLGDWFSASLLTEGKQHFTYARMGGTKVFRKGSTAFSMKDFIASIIEKVVSMDLMELIALLDRAYGVRLDRWKITEALRSSDLYYDPIIERIYINFSAASSSMQ